MLGIVSANSKKIAESENANWKETGDSARETLRRIPHKEEGRFSQARRIRQDLPTKIQPRSRI